MIKNITTQEKDILERWVFNLISIVLLHEYDREKLY